MNDTLRVLHILAERGLEFRPDEAADLVEIVRKLIEQAGGVDEALELIDLVGRVDEADGS